MTGFIGGFKPAERNESVDNALSTYLNTLLFGLTAAKEWLMTFVRGESYPTSSQVLTIGTTKRHYLAQSQHLAGLGGEILTLRERPSKLVDVAPNDIRPYPSEWKIHQGKIFTGTLSSRRLALEVWRRSSFLVFSDQDLEVKVAVKVLSMAVHDCLTDSDGLLVAHTRANEDKEIVRLHTIKGPNSSSGSCF